MHGECMAEHEEMYAVARKGGMRFKCRQVQR